MQTGEAGAVQAGLGSAGQDCGSHPYISLLLFLFFRLLLHSEFLTFLLHRNQVIVFFFCFDVSHSTYKYVRTIYVDGLGRSALAWSVLVSESTQI